MEKFFMRTPAFANSFLPRRFFSALYVVLFATASSYGEALTLEALHNASYKSTDPDIGIVKLKDCVANDYESGRQIHGTYHVAEWDFDGDGTQEVATVICYQKDRKNAEQTDLAIMENNGGTPRQIAAIRIGFTLQVRELQIRDGEILLDLNTDKVCDARGCLYTKRELRRYKFQDSELSLELVKKFSIDARGVQMEMVRRPTGLSYKIVHNMIEWLGLD